MTEKNIIKTQLTLTGELQRVFDTETKETIYLVGVQPLELTAEEWKTIENEVTFKAALAKATDD